MTTITKEQLITLIKGETIRIPIFGHADLEITGPSDPLTVYLAENYNHCDHSGFTIGIYLTKEGAERATQDRDDSYSDYTLSTS